MTVSNDDLLKKIEDLRKDMDSIGKTVTSLRTDGMTKVFREQIGASFLDNNRNAFRAALEKCGGGAVPRETLERLSSLFDRAIARYEDEDVDGAINGLEGLSMTIGQRHGVDLHPLSEAVDSARQQLALMENLRFQMGRPRLRRSCESVFGGMEPETVEAYLTPLASAIRLKIMAMLYTDSRSFTEISKELEMQKGHLQFHLKKLLEAGYVKVDPRTHLYSIEPGAFMIMDGMGRLLANLE